MRTLRFFALVGIFFAFIRPLPTQALSCHQLTDVHPNYVVIGAFRIQRNAMRFTNHAHKDLKLNARYEMNQNRNLYYVYVLNTQDRDEAIAEAMRLRVESEFKDTWVYSGNLGRLKPGEEAYTGVDINPMTNKAMENVLTEKPVEEEKTDTGAMASNTSDPTPSESVAEPEKNEPVPEEPDNDIEGKKFFFQLTRSIDNETVDGEVDVIDLFNVKKLGSYKANMEVKVSRPTGKSGKVSFVCEVFGYRKVQREVDYNAPSGDGIEEKETGSYVVPFALTRLQKGDIAVMYNVYFYKDAGVMRPESRFEVNSLLEMLKENPNYKIKIHGHTNGKANGRIISLDESSTNFFSLSKTKEGFGSAKKLSEERALVIKKFLVSNGIDASRMQIKPWGGKRPVHDKHSTRAQENVRVEIEILED
jgi:outer membrane protein OmpA-like peptidoglycan-associated protein